MLVFGGIDIVDANMDNFARGIVYNVTYPSNLTAKPVTAY